MTEVHANDNTTRPAWYDAAIIEHMPLIRRLAHKYRRGAAADDLAQDISESAMLRWHYYDDKHSFGAWLNLVASYVISDQRQKAGRVKRTAAFVSIEGLPLSAPATQHDYAELSEVLSRLSGTRDSDFLLRHAAGEDMQEIGKEHGISKERVRQLCERERGRLRKMEKRRRRVV